MVEEKKINRYELVNFSTKKLERDTKLWRYLTFEKFEWLLKNSKLWHTRLDSLGDKFEGSYTKPRIASRMERPGHLITGRVEEIVTPRDSLRSILEQRTMSHLYTEYATCWHASAHESDGCGSSTRLKALALR